jgi:mono/diheme cytochrome c family protein
VDVAADRQDASPGREALDRACTGCHGLRALEKYNYSSPDGYRDLMLDMVSRGAVVTDEEMEAIVKYLYKTYGKK